MRFVLILTVALAFSCTPAKPVVRHIEGREIPLTDTIAEDSSVALFLEPYQKHVEAQMAEVLSYAPVTLDKNGKWQSVLGNLFADAVMEHAGPVFLSRTQIRIDGCLLNHGGIRSIIPQGQVTRRTAFEIMPFENSVVVAQMNAEQLSEMIHFLIAGKRAHPVSGISFRIGPDQNAYDISIGGKPLASGHTYYIATNDYLYNGGDNMTFFENTPKTDLDYKLRDVLIDYFTARDTLPVLTQTRISE